MVSVLSRELDEYVLWFKAEQVKTVNWAGNPEKPVEVNENGLMQLSPRHSFDVWRQTVTGVSENWKAEEINSVIRLKEEILNAANLKAGAIRLLNEKLRQAYEELDTFSFTISHDLKNPITAIKTYAQLLNRNESIDARGQKVLMSIVERADKMNYMINEVLDYSRIGRSDINYQKIEMHKLITEIIAELEQVYDTGNLKLTIGSIPDVYGDPVMINQLFTNLISNAIKYSQHVRPATVSIKGEVDGNDVSYVIRDNGIGIPLKDLPKIFELFNRMENAKHIDGTGVGLAIVKRIVEKHSGKIWAESELGKGSSFFVSFTNNTTKGVGQTNA
jgi:light-regulated signal transduction histidine kinase (bacteriophytochrome)